MPRYAHGATFAEETLITARKERRGNPHSHRWVMIGESANKGKDLQIRRSGDEVSAQHADGDLIVVRCTRREEVETLHILTRTEIGPSVASVATMRSVYEHNPESLWTILRRSRDGEDRLTGYFGFLLLNVAGLAALQARTLSGHQPNLAFLAPAGHRPAALYVWAAVARKVRILAERLVAEAMGAERYGGLPIYATAGTLGGLKWLNHLGEADRGPEENGLGHVFRVDTARAVAARSDVA